MDESISIEETNKLRAKLGLKLIPVPDSISKADLSIDETNKLRISLGLKPLEAVSAEDLETQNFKKYQAERESKAKADSIKERLADTRRKLEQRKRPTLSFDEVDEDDWLNNLGKKPKVKTIVPKKKVVDATEELEGVVVNEDMEMEGVMTLKDKSIFDEEDELTNDAFETKQKVDRYMKAQKGKVDEDEDEEGKRVSIKDRIPKGLDDEIFAEEEMEVKSDYHKFKKKKQVSKDKKRKRELDADAIGMFVRGAVALDNTQDVGEQDDEELGKFLSVERNKKLKKNLQVTKSESMDVDAKDGGVVIDEELDFLNKIGPRSTTSTKGPVEEEARDVPLEPAEETAEKKSIISALREKETKAFDGGIGSTLKILSERSIISDTPAAHHRSREEKEVERQMAIELARLEEELAAKINDGSMTRKEREKIMGETRDRFMAKIAKLQEQRMANYNPDVKIVYRDDKGRQLNMKEAWKYSSQKFHGTSKKHS